MVRAASHRAERPNLTATTKNLIYLPTPRLEESP